MIFKYKRMKKEIELLKEDKKRLEYALEQYRVMDFENIKTIAELKVSNRALQDALKIASQETEVDYWKTVLDDDIEKYILKEGEDGPEEQKTHCHCGGSCKDTE